MRGTHGLLGVTLLAAGIAAQWAARAAAGQQAPPAFRSGVTAVPIDVRVVDRDGKPVVDLVASDFTIFEGGVQQPVVFFSAEVLADRPPGPATRARAGVPPFDGAPQTHRIFLLVLGLGALGSTPLGPGTARVPDASNALDGLLHFLRHRLLPQDQVALLAYNRATDFSSDHEALASVLEQFRLSEREGVLALARYSAPAPVRAPAASVTPSARPLAAGPELELGFAEYVSARTGPASDLENLQYGVKYLRFVPGEKHLIYLSAMGIREPMPGTWESAQVQVGRSLTQLAAAANDGRVALHVIQTGGIPADPGPFLGELPVMRPRILVPGQAQFGLPGSGSGSGGQALPQPGWDRPRPDSGVPLPGLDATSMQALSRLRDLARVTGGHASIMTDARDAIERIDVETRVTYLLAYQPVDPVSDGRYRTVRVEVNRPGVTVFFRHGYHAEVPGESLSRRAVVSDRRLIAATVSTRAMRDIGIVAQPTFVRSERGKGGDVELLLTIDASHLTWTTDELARRVAHLDLAIYCADRGNKVVGQTRRALDVGLTEARMQQVAATGLPYRVAIPVTARPRFLKIVVYDYGADRVGSTVAAVK